MLFSLSPVNAHMHSSGTSDISALTDSLSRNQKPAVMTSPHPVAMYLYQITERYKTS